MLALPTHCWPLPLGQPPSGGRPHPVLLVPQGASEAEPREHRLRSHPDGNARPGSINELCDFEKDTCEMDHLPQNPAEPPFSLRTSREGKNNALPASRSTARIEQDSECESPLWAAGRLF